MDNKRYNKYLVLVFALILAFQLVGCDDAKTAKPTIGVVDLEKISQSSKLPEEAMKYLDSYADSVTSELQQLEQKVQQLASPEGAELESLVARYQELQVDYQKRQEALSAQVADIFNKTLDEERAAQGLDIIVQREVALSYDKALDVTDAVINRLKDVKLDLVALEKSINADKNIAQPDNSVSPSSVSEAQEAPSAEADNAQPKDAQVQSGAEKAEAAKVE